jgi:2-dehydropantoate 2-reductase
VADNQWPQIAVMGAGAVGCYFGAMLARAGAPVTLIGRAHHIEPILKNGLFVDSAHFQGHVAINASTDPGAANSAGLVLFAVKTFDTETAAKELAGHLAADSVVVSLQNGVDNVERIRSAAGIDAVPCAVYIGVSMSAPGCVKHNGRGDLVLGTDSRYDANGIAAVFDRAGVPCHVSDNIAGELWTKLVMNCAYNAISALTRARYGRIVRDAGTSELMRRVVDECVAVARAAGVRLANTDLAEPVFALGYAMENALSSTAQDIARGRSTEIDSFNGYVATRGAELGVPAPVNQALHALVKLLEQKLS